MRCLCSLQMLIQLVGTFILTYKISLKCLLPITGTWVSWIVPLAFKNLPGPKESIRIMLTSLWLASEKVLRLLAQHLFLIMLSCGGVASCFKSVARVLVFAVLRCGSVWRRMLLEMSCSCNCGCGTLSLQKIQCRDFLQRWQGMASQALQRAQSKDTVSCFFSKSEVDELEDEFTTIIRKWTDEKGSVYKYTDDEWSF